MCKNIVEITALIVNKRGNLLSIGKNSYSKTHPYQKRLSEKFNNPHKCFLHAEIAAIIRCKNHKKAYKMIITRFDSKGNYALSKPCVICQEAIKLSNIKYIEYSTKNGYVLEKVEK